MIHKTSQAGSALASKLVIEQSPLRASVIIPTYYRDKELSELLNSLLRQRVKPIEVIVVDDTPTDMISHVCEDYEVAFLKVGVTLLYIRNTRDRSTSIARNIGAKMARGDILLFVDSDVVLFRDYIQELLETYNEHPECLGVAGWIAGRPHLKDIRHYVATPRRYGIRYHSLEILRKLFFLFHDARNSCRFFEFPVVLTKMISCQRLGGSNMSWRRDVFKEYAFDENLKGYAFMEDGLLSGTVFKEHPGKLLMTPDAKCYHVLTEEGRTEQTKLGKIKLRNRKYVLTALFGTKGLLIFGWQNLGLLFLRLIMRIRKKEVEDIFL